MKKKINEEIERIKSLFTEERLYGNLVKEQVTNPDSNGDFVIDTTEFTASGNDITADEAKLFVNAYHTANPTRNTEVGHCINQPVIQTMVDKFPKLVESPMNYGVTSLGGKCYLYSNNRGTISYTAQITKLEFWQNEWITFYVTLKTPIDLSTEDDYKKTFNKNWSNTKAVTPGTIEMRVKLNETANRTEKIKYLQYKAPITSLGPTPTYGQITFMNFYDESGNKKTIQSLIDKIDETGTYGGWMAGDGTGSTYQYDPSVDMDGLLQDTNTTNLSVTGGDIKEMVDNLIR
jgi:hypothetical protein